MHRTLEKMDLSWIQDDLAVGGRVALEHHALLARLGIRGVVDCRSEDRDDAAALARHGIELLHLPTLDEAALTDAALREGTHWVRVQRAAGRKVLIHCTHGMGRSPLLAACVLVADGSSPQQALQLLKTRRARVCPAPEQLQALLRFAAACQGTPQPAGAPCTCDELTEILCADSVR